jgi:hypothetical protein
MLQTLSFRLKMERSGVAGGVHGYRVTFRRGGLSGTRFND